MKILSIKPSAWVKAPPSIDRDTDEPLIPPADRLVLLPAAIQFPAALCETMKEILGVVLGEHWKLTLE